MSWSMLGQVGTSDVVAPSVCISYRRRQQQHHSYLGMYACMYVCMLVYLFPHRVFPSGLEASQMRSGPYEPELLNIDYSGCDLFELHAFIASGFLAPLLHSRNDRRCAFTTYIRHTYIHTYLHTYVGK